MPDQANTERTLVLIKPDAVHRRLIGEIVSRFERKGLRIVGMKLMQIDRSLAERHYAVHKGKPFYEPLLTFITAGPVVALILEGPEAIAIVRHLMGATNPLQAAPGTIRADFATEITYNLVHGSDSAETAAFEMGLFFAPGELVTYPSPSEALAIE
jgi:nucleoside-diphosphate kinase